MFCSALISSSLVYRSLGDATTNLRGATAASRYDAALVSPVFFGYAWTLDADLDAARAKVGA